MASTIEEDDGTDNMDLPEYSIGELQGHFVRGELNAVRLCEAFLARIARIDYAGPTLRSVIELNPDALTIAAELDQERQDKGSRGPLHGVPMLIKSSRSGLCPDKNDLCGACQGGP
jgi:amidase